MSLSSIWIFYISKFWSNASALADALAGALLGALTSALVGAWLHALPGALEDALQVHSMCIRCALDVNFHVHCGCIVVALCV